MNADTRIPPHGGQLRRIAEHFGVPAAGLLDFSANINPDGPSTLAVAALREALSDPTILTHYPDLEERELKLSISASANLEPDTVVVANGFVPLLDGTLRAFPIRRCLMPVPAFGEYRRSLERAGVEVTSLVLDQGTGFVYEPEALLAALQTGSHDAILLANPQNPSGVLCDRATLCNFVEQAAKLGVFVLLDEAFIDYAPEHSMAGEAIQFANLIVFRSVTKFHGLPGLRVAYATAQPVNVEKIRQNLAPWAITTLATIAVRAALSDTLFAELALQRNHVRRQDLIAHVNALGLVTYPAAANFFLIRFASHAEADRCWEELFMNHQIVLRNCGNFEGLGNNHLRCAVLGGEENLRLVEALARVSQ